MTVDSWGAILRGARLAAGLTQSEVAERAGLSVRALRYIESGRVAQPRRDSLDRLAQAVGLDRGKAPWEEDAGRTGTTAQVDGPYDIRVLGPLSVSCDGRAVALPLKQRVLLGLLAIQPNRTVSHGEMADVLWSGEAPPSGTDLLHSYVARLRRTIKGGGGPGRHCRISTVRGGYLLEAHPAMLDLLRFEELGGRAAAARESDPALALELFGRAFQYWRGPVLEDLPVLRQHPAAVAIAQQRIELAVEFADLALGRDRPAFVVEQLRMAACEEPLHEGVQARLMLALADSGRRAAALRLFCDLRRQFREELGVEPSEEVWEARRRILHQSGAVAGQAGAPGRDEAPERDEAPGRRDERQHLPPPRARFPARDGIAAPAQLPPLISPFVGRRSELAELDELLARRREDCSMAVAAIHGPAELGKTALAVLWSHRTLDRFPDGQLYADLQGSAGTGRPARPGEVLGCFLRSLGVARDRIPADPEEASALFRTVLAGRRVLVLLDDARSSAQLRPLLPGTSGNLVLVTSRRPLTDLVARNGARSLALDALSGPEARELLEAFLGRERTAAEPQAAAALAEACGRRPLALRMVAARLASMPGVSIGAWVRDIEENRETTLPGRTHTVTLGGQCRAEGG
ncbi:BTAD domain-containing putative transcriptional regulator [Kitasatospora sp. NPDC048296]|uniref:BTAD domain-containing putative transcriptional regulator n=1 Tax=Kitasatospora sp. NPDC048296 TaxID=3364048 RepID=UPI003717F5CB